MTSAAVERFRAARAVNLGAEGLGKPKWDCGRNWIAVMMKIVCLCLLDWMLWWWSEEFLWALRIINTNCAKLKPIYSLVCCLSAHPDSQSCAWSHAVYDMVERSPAKPSGMWADWPDHLIIGTRQTTKHVTPDIHMILTSSHTHTRVLTLF